MVTLPEDLLRPAAQEQTDPVPGASSGPSPAQADADLSTALLADLHDWAVNLETRSFTQAAVSLLGRDLRRAVPSSFGFSLRLTAPPGLSDVWITAMDERLTPGEVRSCLTFDLPSRPGAVATAGARPSASFFATAPAAFDQLGALLAEAGRTGDRVLLTGAPDRPVVPGVQGLADYTRVNLAFGVLLGRGYSFVEARSRLANLARRYGSVESAAAQLLASFDE